MEHEEGRAVTTALPFFVCINKKKYLTFKKLNFKILLYYDKP